MVTDVAYDQPRHESLYVSRCDFLLSQVALDKNDWYELKCVDQKEASHY